MSRQRLSLLIALGMFVWSCIIVQTKDVLAQPDSASPRDYGITEGARRDTSDPLVVGEFVFSQRCSTCHARTAGRDNVYGPHLSGIFGREVGATSWPKHSTALNGMDGTWTETSLEKLLRDPQGSFPGLNKNIQVRFKKSRTALIAYLKTL